MSDFKNYDEWIQYTETLETKLENIDKIQFNFVGYN